MLQGYLCKNQSDETKTEKLPVDIWIGKYYTSTSLTRQSIGILKEAWTK